MTARSDMLASSTCKVLMIYPRFAADTFWNFAETCEIFGAKYPAAPLGLITVAALLPSSWSIWLVNRNTEELTDGDLDWADLVVTGGMLPQQIDTLDIIDLCRARGKPVAVGGPAVSSSPHIYRTANFRVVGEAEDIIVKFVEAWEGGEHEGLFEAEKFQVDVTKSPVPRFDLLKLIIISTLVCSFRGAVRSPASSAISSSFTAEYPHQNQRTDARGTRRALPTRLPRSCRLRGRQSYRQQEVAQSIPSGTHEVGLERATIPSNLRPRHRSTSLTILNF